MIRHCKLDCNAKVMKRSGIRNNFDFQLSDAALKKEIPALEKKEWKRIKEAEIQVRKEENRNREDMKAICF